MYHNTEYFFKFLIALFTLTCASSPTYSQQLSFPYKDIYGVEVVNKKVDMDFSDFTDATQYLPKNFVTDGSINYRQHLQQALNENKKLIFPNFPILIDDIGLDIQSDSDVYFPENSLIQLKPTTKANYDILRIQNRQNIRLFNPKIKGDRLSHIGTTGEWGMGLSILGSSRIEIFNPHITDCWGDGVYLGYQSVGNSHIVIKGGIVDNNRRNAVSVIDVNYLEISDIVLSNSNGVLPMSGLHFEPNATNEDIRNVLAKNIVTYNNRKSVGTSLMRLIGENPKTVNIKIENLTDHYSNLVPFHIGGHRSKFDHAESPLTGRIIFDGLEINDPNSDFIVLVDKYIDYLPDFVFRNVNIYQNRNRNSIILGNSIKEVTAKTNIQIE